MVAVPSQPPPLDDEDQRLLLHGVAWDQYCALLDALGDTAGLRVTYLDGALELMSPSSAHEVWKKIFARFLEAYAEEADINLNGFGSTTYRNKKAKRGAEPDECYTIGRGKTVPDLAIEVVLNAPKIDKLDVYRGLGVGEVWIHHRGKLTIHVLTPEGYVEREKSALLPELDLELLMSFVRPDEDQTPLVKAYRAELRRLASLS